MPVVAHVGSLLRELKREYDVVLIDTPPLRVSADTEFLASISDMTLVAVEAGKATRKELVQGITLLGQLGTPSIGVIMNPPVSVCHHVSIIGQRLLPITS